jgi:hypothetical protein
VNLESEPTEEALPDTELLFDQLDELKNAIYEHRRSILYSESYDAKRISEANTKLWGFLD